jgi:hypothetical protein
MFASTAAPGPKTPSVAAVFPDSGASPEPESESRSAAFKAGFRP